VRCLTNVRWLAENGYGSPDEQKPAYQSAVWQAMAPSNGACWKPIGCVHGRLVAAT